MLMFSDLPPELVLEVCDFLYSGSPKIIEQAFAGITRHSTNNSKVYKVVRDPWNDLLSLSRTSRRYREFLVDQHKRVYRVITVHGSDNFTNYISLLRLLDAKPDVAANVKTLVFELSPQRTTSAMAELEAEDLKLVKTQAAAADISFPKGLWKNPKDPKNIICPHCGAEMVDFMEGNHDVIVCEDCLMDWDPEGIAWCDYKRMAMLTILVLHKMKGLEQLGCVVDPDFFKMINYNSMWSLPTLSQLQYFAVSAEHEYESLRPNDFSVLADLGHAATQLHLHDTGESMGTITPQMYDNVAHLVLSGSTLGGAALYHLLNKGCGRLTSFKYIPATPDDLFGMDEDDDGGPSSPQDVVDALLSKHAKTLRTLCIDFTWIAAFGDWKEQDIVEGLEGFVKLENLWLDCNIISLAHPDAENPGYFVEITEVISRLPRTLQRICFVGGVEFFDEDMVRLAASKKDFPHLQSVELETDVNGIMDAMAENGLEPSLAAVKHAMLWKTG